MKSLNSFLFGEETCFTIHGYPSCPYYQRAIKLGDAIEQGNKNIKVTVNEVDKEEWKEFLEKESVGLGQRAKYHQTCPMVVEGCTDDSKAFVGGFSDFLNQSKKRNYLKSNK
ncbi:hypothetical protein DICPUDRAFT_28107 [Dictyostelium purpureum]|uniref:Glutaredoxin domain-containing protein n=1 Tax=Dictyostelium purpureum TaxID=5786 RepID=F0ZBF4_DICPU|nr:uncharacterized protein DICPUDRAFT_28107 [Dictyostelium purpureum]EGC38737.1 hypothetical protein DICPUDRAFT_28107 [Dictyostelium purpureum]|eukprot:XP_003284728.1 hypothetical protein DICPUDRAFT_28107 [Dictyostelium purpureum]